MKMSFSAGQHEALGHHKRGYLDSQSIQDPAFRKRRLVDFLRADLANQGSCRFNA